MLGETVGAARAVAPAPRHGGSGLMQQLSGMDAVVPLRRDARAHMAGGGISIYDPSTAPGGTGDVQGDPRPHRQAAARGPGVPPAAGAGAVRPRPPVLDRGPRLRPRVPRPPHRPAGAGRLAPAVHPGGPAGVPPARPRPAAVGAVRHRGPRQRRGRPHGQLRRRHQGPPRRHRRHVGDGDDERHPRRRARRPSPPVPATAWRPSRCRAPPSCCGGPASTTPPDRCTPAG